MSDHHRPRWVTGTVIVLALVLIAVVVVHLTVGSPFAHGGAVVTGFLGSQ